MVNSVQIATKTSMKCTVGCATQDCCPPQVRCNLGWDLALSIATGPCAFSTLTGAKKQQGVTSSITYAAMARDPDVVQRHISQEVSMPIWLRNDANGLGHLFGTTLSLFQLLCLLKEGRPINDFSGSFPPQDFLQTDGFDVRIHMIHIITQWDAMSNSCLWSVLICIVNTCIALGQEVANASLFSCQQACIQADLHTITHHWPNKPAANPRSSRQRSCSTSK